MTDYAPLASIVEELNRLPNLTARLNTSHNKRAAVEIEPKAPLKVVNIDTPVATLLAKLLAERDLGYLKVSHSTIGQTAVPILEYAVRMNKTAIEIAFCSMTDGIANDAMERLSQAARQSKNGNLDVFRPFNAHFGRQNVSKASALMSLIAATPYTTTRSQLQEVNDHLYLIEALASCRWGRNPKGFQDLQGFARNLIGIARSAQSSGIDMRPSAHFIALAQGRSDENIGEMPRPLALVSGGIAQGDGIPVVPTHADIAELIKRHESVERRL